MRDNVYQDFFQSISGQSGNIPNALVDNYTGQVKIQIATHEYVADDLPTPTLKVVPGALLEVTQDFVNDPVKIRKIIPNHVLSRRIQLKKRAFDLTFSLCVMLAGLPLFAMLYLVTKLSSRGPAFYKQERLGKNKRKFYIYKFRSMRVDAEKFGPQLSSTYDPRITKWGRLIRRTRLDELPQFWNVFKGDMSVVGPRPERQHFAEKIVEQKSDYRKLQCLKPGITSLGQIHYGYAENLDQMCARVDHDLHYIRNITLRSDVTIILKTVQVMIEGKGK